METFSYTPQFVWSTTSSFNVLETTFESGKTQRRFKGNRPKEWTLSFKGKWSDLSGILNFYEARKGSLEAFNWAPPGEVNTISVVFKENSLQVSRHGLTMLAEIQLVIKEVLS